MTGRWRIPLSDLHYGEAERKAVDAVVSGGWISMGPRVEEFEQEFSKLSGARYAVAVSSGTAALHLALLSIGLGQGDEVIQPELNFVSAANMTVAIGARPVFADIRSLDDPTIDAESIRRLVTPSTRAVVVMHYGGRAASMEDIEKVCSDWQLPIVEDACHAVGGTYRPTSPSRTGVPVGSRGHLACFSFFSNKNVAIGEGGMITTDDPEVADRIRLMRSHGMTSRSWDRFAGHASDYDVALTGFNYRLDDIHAALGICQLRQLSAMNDKRRALATEYVRSISAVRGWSVPGSDERGEHAWHIMVAIAPDRETRDLARHELAQRGIQTSLHYPEITSFSSFTDQSGSPRPITRKFTSRALTLPLYPDLPVDAVSEIGEVLGGLAHL